MRLLFPTPIASLFIRIGMSLIFSMGVSSLLLTGCGYHLGRGGVVEEYTTVCIPYVEGDPNGLLTSALVYEISSRGTLQYRNCQAELELSVVIRDIRLDNVGFRYEKESSGNTNSTVVPTETRLTALAEVVVHSSGAETPLIGPDLVVASTTFDHDFYSNQAGVNVFSLGQINDLDLAEEEAYRPLYRELARRITEHVFAVW